MEVARHWSSGAERAGAVGLLARDDRNEDMWGRETRR